MDGSIADDVQAIRALLIEHGRCRGHMTIDCRLCLWAAVTLVWRIEHYTPERINAVEHALVAHLPGDRSGERWGCEQLIMFNDAATDEEVFALIDKTLADLGALT